MDDEKRHSNEGKSGNDHQQTAPVGLTIDAACKYSGLARSRIYELIGTGDVCAKKAGKRTIVITATLNDYIAKLPAAAIRTRGGSDSPKNSQAPSRSAVR